jgi:GntR family transcriptional regulator, rspAB operon transcriptional repressor
MRAQVAPSVLLPADVAIDQTLSRSAQAYALLRDAIVSLWLKPGEVINEKAICEQLGISRTPVREALTKLSEEGLVQIFPQSGTFVSPIELEQVFEGQIVRDALETAMVRRAVHRFTPEFDALFQNILDRQRSISAQNDYQAFYVSDEEFHRTISQCAGSLRIWRIINGAKAQLDRVRRLNMPVPGQLDQIITEHQAILDGLRTGKEALAAKAMKAHLNAVFEAVQVLMDQHAEYFSAASLAETPGSHTRRPRMAGGRQV